MNRKIVLTFLIFIQCLLLSLPASAYSAIRETQSGSPADSAITIEWDTRSELVDIVTDNAALPEILSTLTEKTGKTFMIKGFMPKQAVSVNIKQKQVKEALNVIVQASNCTWWTDENDEKEIYYIKYGYGRKQSSDITKLGENVYLIQIRHAEIGDIEKALSLVLKPINSSATNKGAKLEGPSNTLGSFTADETQKTILVNLVSGNTLGLIEKIISEYDVPVPVIKIKVVVLELTEENSENNGIELKNIAMNATRTNTAFDGSRWPTNSTIAIGRTTTISGNTGGNINYENLFNKGKVLALVTARVLNNQQVLLSTGDKVPIFSMTKDGFPDVKLQDILVSVKVTPSITQFDKDILHLDIESKVSLIDKQQVQFGIAAPQVSTSEAKTQINVKHGMPYHVGDIKRDEVVTDKSSVPILGKIPLLKSFFTNTYQHHRNKVVSIILYATVEEPVAEGQ